MGTSYDVVINYSSTGDLGGGLERGLKKAKFKGDEFIGNFASSFNSAFDSVATSIASKLVDAGKAAAVAIGASVALGIKEGFKFNAESETAALSLGGIFNMTGETKSFTEGVNLAGRTVMQMRKDAQELPGEFADLQNIMQRIAPAGKDLGLDAWGMEHLASRTMMSAAMLGMTGHGGMDTAGREMAALMEGRASERMPLFAKLGLGDSKTFNKLSGREKLAKVNASLDKLNEGKEAVMGSWATVSSNLTDKLKQGAGAVTMGLFDRVKGTLSGYLNRPKDDPAAQAAYDSRAAKLEALGIKVSDYLVKAFDRGTAAIEKWVPATWAFVQTMEGGLKRVLKGVDELGGGLLNKVFNFLQDRTAFDKIERVLSMALALRGGSAVLSVAPGLMSGLEALGVGGGAATAGGGALAGILGPAALAVGALAFAAAGAVSAITDTTSAFHDLATAGLADVSKQGSKLGGKLGELWDNLKPVAELLGTGLIGALDAFLYTLNGVVSGMTTLTGWIGSAGHAVVNTVVPSFDKDRESLKKFNDSIEGDNKSMYEQSALDTLAFGSGIHVKQMDTGAEGEDNTKIKPPKVHQTIHKVEIKVEGSEDPDRVADLTLSKLRDLANNPKTSPDDIRSAPWRGRGF